METKSISTRLTELYDLLEKGAITREEYELFKSKIIDQDHNELINKVDVQLSDKSENVKNHNKSNGDRIGSRKNSKRILTSILIFIVLIFIIFAAKILISNNNDVDAELARLTKNETNSYEAAKKIELYQLKKFSQLVNRSGDKLVFKIDNGNNVTLKDQPKDGETILFTFRNFYENINSYFVEVHFNEGGVYSLYNKTTGEKIDMPGIIKISPDNSRLLSFRVGYEEENLIEIYNYSNNSYRKEFKFEPKEWSPTNAKWIDNNHFEIEKSELHNESNKIGKVIFKYDGFWKEQ